MMIMVIGCTDKEMTTMHLSYKICVCVLLVSLVILKENIVLSCSTKTVVWFHCFGATQLRKLTRATPYAPHVIIP